MKEINVEEAKALVKDQSVIIVDIRDADSYEKGHLPRATHLSAEKVEDFLRQTEKSFRVLCYCYHGISSQSAAAFLENNGFREVYSLAGGYAKWVEINETGH